MAINALRGNKIEFSSEAKPQLPFLEQLQHPYILKHVGVYRAKRAVHWSHCNLKFHSYVVIGNYPTQVVPKKLQRSEVVFFGWAGMYVHLHVSDNLLKKVEASNQLTEATKQQVKELAGQSFAGMDGFFRAILAKKNLPPEIIYALSAAEPYVQLKPIYAPINKLKASYNQNIQELAKLQKMLSGEQKDSAIEKFNELQKICQGQALELHRLNSNPYLSILWELNELDYLNDEVTGKHGTVFIGNQGAVFLMDKDTRFVREDHDAFDKMNADVTSYPTLRATDWFELKQQQLLFKRFIEDKAQLGFYEEEKRSQPSTHQVMKRLAQFMKIPSFTDPFTANCNKSTTAVVEALTDMSITKTQKDPVKIELDDSLTSSMISYGSQQKMFLWNSPFHREMINLFINREFKEDDPRCLEEMDSRRLQKYADQKYYIFAVIKTWPLEQQKRGLEQLANPKTPLGKVAHTTSKVAWMDDVPNFLAQIAEQLTTVNKDMQSEKELPEDWIPVEVPSPGCS